MIITGGGGGVDCYSDSFVLGRCWRFRGGGRVRTRNTLHIVGARKSSICYNAVEGRRKMKKKKEENVIKHEILEIVKCDKMKILMFVKI